jgi:acylaminoacyl-peptidase
VLLPFSYDPQKKYPAILNIHGGPKGAFGTVFFNDMQFLAGQGYFVLFCNPRGSEGKGNVFAEMRGQYGTYDYDNLMQFVDLCIEKYPAIDSSRLGVTGGSYGGFMTNWIIGHTDRFKAAVSLRSVSNWLSLPG